MVVHHRGHDGLAGEIDAGGAFRRLDLARSTDLRDLSHLHDERAALDAAAVADDEPRAFEEERIGELVRLAAGDLDCRSDNPAAYRHQPAHGGHQDTAVTV